MLKIMFGFLGMFVVIALGTGFGLLPPLIGLIVLVIFAVIQTMIFLILARGPPMEFIRARLGGGMVLTVVRRDRQAAFGKVKAQAGMIRTKRHGAFNLMPGTIYSAGGIPWALAPEKVGYNVGVDHAQFTNELEKRGIENISEITDADEYGRVTGVKDDKRIKKPMKVKPWTVCFDNFYRYIAEASNPIHAEANIQLGISQGLLGQAVQKWGWLIFAGLGAMFACIGVYLLLQYSGGGAKEVVHYIVDNTGKIIPI